jgi:hypothetical protein
MMQFSFNPDAAPFAPVPHRGSDDGLVDPGKGGRRRQSTQKPAVDLKSFPSINGKGEMLVITSAPRLQYLPL